MYDFKFTALIVGCFQRDDHSNAGGWCAILYFSKLEAILAILLDGILEASVVKKERRIRQTTSLDNLDSRYEIL